MVDQSGNGVYRWLIPTGRALLFLLALNFFFISISLLSAFKGTSTDWVQGLILQLAHNPLLGLVVGILITSVAQSSSATTSMVVGLAAGGLFGEDLSSAVQIAVPVIMGANIGTTVTNTLVSLGHIGHPDEFRRAFAAGTVHDFFNLLCVVIFLPLQIATNFLGKFAVWLGSLFVQTGGLKMVSPLKLVIKPQAKLIASLFNFESVCYAMVIFTVCFILLHLMRLFVRAIILGKHRHRYILMIEMIVALLGVAFQAQSQFLFSKPFAQLLLAGFLLFGSLAGIVSQSRRLVQTRLEVLFHRYIFKNRVPSLLAGALLTAAVQSSSVTTSIVIPLAGAGILRLNQIFFYTLGANLGTTVTAILAAMATANPIAISIALAHLLFNILGILVFFPLAKAPIAMADAFAKLTLRWRWVPIAFVALVFFAIPLSLIAIFK